MLYSNTPKDFDFKLSQTATPLSPDELAAVLRSSDLVFPAMHGEFGEDGEVQPSSKSIGVAFVGSDSEASGDAYDKYSAYETLRRSDFRPFPPSCSAVPIRRRGVGPRRRGRGDQAGGRWVEPRRGGGRRLGERRDRRRDRRTSRPGRDTAAGRWHRVHRGGARRSARPGGPAAGGDGTHGVRRDLFVPGEVHGQRRRALSLPAPPARCRHRCPPGAGRARVHPFGLRDFARIDCWRHRRRRVPGLRHQPHQWHGAEQLLVHPGRPRRHGSPRRAAGDGALGLPPPRHR